MTTASLHEENWIRSKDPRSMLKWLLGANNFFEPNSQVTAQVWHDCVSERKLRLLGFNLWRTRQANSKSRDMLEHEAEDRKWIDSPTDKLVNHHWNLYAMGADYFAENSIESYTKQGIRPTKMVLPAMARENSYRVSIEDTANMIRDIFDPWQRIELPKGPKCHDCTAPYGTNQYDCDCKTTGYKPCLWLTPTVRKLINAAYYELDDNGRLESERLFVLSDALEEAMGEDCEIPCKVCMAKNWPDRKWGLGWFLVRDSDGHFSVPCTNCGGVLNGAENGTGRVPHPFLVHLRNPVPHFPGCHVLDTLIGLE